MGKEPKFSLKNSMLAAKILIVPFTCGYAQLFIKVPQTIEIVFGIVGFLYFYNIYVLASHLFLKGAIKMKPASIFWIAFFSSVIPLVHLITPLYLLKKGGETLKLGKRTI